MPNRQDLYKNTRNNKTFAYTFISALVGITYMNLKKVLQQFKNPAISGSGM
jgi:hypothetical protein